MRCNYTVDSEGRLAGLAMGVYNSEAPVIDLPDDFNPLYMQDYKVVDGQLVHDPLPAPEYYDEAADTDGMLLDLMETVTLLELGVI